MTTPYFLHIYTQTTSTLVSVICDAWMSRNQRQPKTSQQGKPFTFQYSELASYDNRQNISRQGFCMRMIVDADTALHLPSNNTNNNPHTANTASARQFMAVYTQHVHAEVYI